MSKDANDEKYFEFSTENESAELIPLKPVIISESRGYDSRFSPEEKIVGVKKLTIDCSKIELYDSFFVVFAAGIEEYCKAKEIDFSLVGMTDEMERFYRTLSRKIERKVEPKEKRPFWREYPEYLGDLVKIFAEDSRLFIAFLGDLIFKMFLLIVKPLSMRWKDFPGHFSRAGVSAVPIVTLIVFLIGMITGYQGAMQLKQFGADIYIADLVGISIARELSPLMSAILVAGRSGSAYAAEIGTMKVSEEVDALNSLGFDIMGFLILPRVLAVAVAMPFLVAIANFAGIGGGLIAALASLDVSFVGFMNELNHAMNFAHLFIGLGKSVVFGFLIATVGCYRGLQVRGGAESVGKYTTAAVVSGVLLIILADFVFTFVFDAIGI